LLLGVTVALVPVQEFLPNFVAAERPSFSSILRGLIHSTLLFWTLRHALQDFLSLYQQISKAISGMKNLDVTSGARACSLSASIRQ